MSLKTLILVAAAALVTGTAPPAPAPMPLIGVWQNPKGTVAVRISPCGRGVCGTVVGASDTAIADARDSGYANLVGMEVMHDYRPARRGAWQGQIFVPDLGRRLSSQIEMVDADHARVSGCLLGRFLCKSQLWRRA